MVNNNKILNFIDNLSLEESFRELAECWSNTRVGQVLPTRARFMEKVLDFPTMIRDLAIVDLSKPDKAWYKLMGSDRAAWRREDATNKVIYDTFHPSARPMISSCFSAMATQPFAAFWEGATKLQNGDVGKSQNLTLPLGDSEELVDHIASVARPDRIVISMAGNDKLNVASNSLELTLIDLGAGVPEGLQTSLKVDM